MGVLPVRLWVGQKSVGQELVSCHQCGLGRACPERSRRKLASCHLSTHLSLYVPTPPRPAPCRAGRLNPSAPPPRPKGGGRAQGERRPREPPPRARPRKGGSGCDRSAPGKSVRRAGARLLPSYPVSCHPSTQLPPSWARAPRIQAGMARPIAAPASGTPAVPAMKHSALTSAMCSGTLWLWRG